MPPDPSGFSLLITDKRLMIPGAAKYDIEIDVSENDVTSLLSIRPSDVDPAPALTFCKNVFIPLTTACRYTCTYCTYFDPPGQASLLSPSEVTEILRTGANAGCTEALFTFGDDPDDRYTQIYAQLAEWGHESIHSYLRKVCELALAEGLLPHSNPGDQTREQMELVSDLNPSMGVMLETTADVPVHAGPRKKSPGQRLNTIKTAGILRVPFTTGILVGIGESWSDRAESLLAIRALHEQYGHIQEIIIQPVVNNERWSNGSPDLEALRRVVAMARNALPQEVSIQVPPNLAPVRELLDCGVDDLGGVSPVTQDHINPEYQWPALRELEEIAEFAGVPLRERLPVHHKYITDEWLSPRIKQELRADTPPGRRYRSIINSSGITQ